MRIFLVIVVLGLLFFLIRQQTDFQATVQNIDPLILGYGALFGAGIVSAELLRPLLTYVSGTVRFMIVATIAALGWWGISTLQTNEILPVAGAPEQKYSLVAEIPLAWDGHFRTVAQINEADVGVLVDTGASLVVLTFDEAARIGFEVTSFEFSQPLSTAGSRIHVSPVTFDSVKIGDIKLENVKGAIAQKGDLQVNVVGLSFLTRLGVATVKGNTMTLRR